MITNLDAHVRYATILDDADLDAVSGGAGYVADAAVRAALGVLFKGAMTDHMNGEFNRAVPPPCY